MNFVSTQCLSKAWYNSISLVDVCRVFSLFVFLKQTPTSSFQSNFCSFTFRPNTDCSSRVWRPFSFESNDARRTNFPFRCSRLRISANGQLSPRVRRCLPSNLPRIRSVGYIGVRFKSITLDDEHESYLGVASIATVSYINFALEK